MAAADDDIIWPLTGNDNLIVAGLPPENDNNTRDDATMLFGVDVSSGSAASIDLDGGGGEGATATGPLVCSNGSTPSVVGTDKRQFTVWADFDEIYETVKW